MWQAEHVGALLERHHPSLAVEIVPIRTLGDKDRSSPLPGLGRTGVFTKEIEDALRDGRCDVAVHSMKDLPTRLAPGLSVGAVLERADPRDAMISRSGRPLAHLPEGARLGTSSLRRRAQVLHLRPDLEIRDLRGNVPTRLRAAGVDMDGGKEPSGGELDAVILAYAGLHRLGASSHVTEIFTTDQMLPAPRQGAIAVEIRAEDGGVAELLIPLDHGPTRRATAAEGEFLESLGGWCHIPVGALAQLDGEEILLEGVVADTAGKTVLRGDARGGDPRRVGAELAENLKRRGADEILKRVLEENPAPQAESPE
jgi:hydroxymethylbilane synthase